MLSGDDEDDFFGWSVLTIDDAADFADVFAVNLDTDELVREVETVEWEVLDALAFAAVVRLLEEFIIWVKRDGGVVLICNQSR